jgi:hypothetical protein
MKKKYILFLFVLLLIHFISWSQKVENKNYPILVENFRILDKAFIQKDTLILNLLLHTNLSFGHSNGWLEKKPDLIQTLKTEKVTYLVIAPAGAAGIEHQTKNFITLRRNIDVAGLFEGTTFYTRLNVLEVWIKEAGKWQLLARQSVKRKE